MNKIRMTQNCEQRIKRPANIYLPLAHKQTHKHASTHTYDHANTDDNAALNRDMKNWQNIISFAAATAEAKDHSRRRSSIKRSSSSCCADASLAPQNASGSVPSEFVRSNSSTRKKWPSAVLHGSSNHESGAEVSGRLLMLLRQAHEDQDVDAFDSLSSFVSNVEMLNNSQNKEQILSQKEMRALAQAASALCICHLWYARLEKMAAGQNSNRLLLRSLGGEQANSNLVSLMGNAELIDDVMIPKLEGLGLTCHHHCKPLAERGGIGGARRERSGREPMSEDSTSTRKDQKVLEGTKVRVIKEALVQTCSLYTVERALWCRHALCIVLSEPSGPDMLSV